MTQEQVDIKNLFSPDEWGQQMKTTITTSAITLVKITIMNEQAAI
jgi:hypothetical protein